MPNTKRKIFQIVYVSKLSIVLRDLEISQILESANRQNAAYKVSGILISRGDYFIQLLEGDREKVTETIQRIKVDRRHKEVKILIEHEVEKRLFPKWSMGLIDNKGLANTAAEIVAKIDKITSGGVMNQDTVMQVLKSFNGEIPKSSTSTAVINKAASPLPSR